MSTELTSTERRAALHRALGDERRLAIVDALRLSDRTPSELLELTDGTSNLVAFHLGVLEELGLIDRSPSQGDARRRYVRLVRDPLVELVDAAVPAAERILFVCTANSARSQLAEALWRDHTGRAGVSAGTRPADQVHPLARAVAARHGLDLGAATPRGYEDVEITPDLIVSVCDRAHESGLPFDAPRLHWSIPDPAHGDEDDFERVYQQLAERIDRLASATARAA